MAGAFLSREERRGVSEQPQKDTNSPPTTPAEPVVAPKDIPIPLLTSVEMLPVTKVPALDTLDQYAIDQPITATLESSPRSELVCSTDAHNLANSLVQGYARFIAHLTGLEDIAFFISRYGTFLTTSEPTRGVVCASVSGSEHADDGDRLDCTILEFHESQHDQEELQFSLDLGQRTGHVNGETQPAVVPENRFTLSIEPTANNRILAIGFTYPPRLIPHATVRQLLNTLTAHLVGSSASLTSNAPAPELSIHNFPPLMIPPSHDLERDRDLNTTSGLLHVAFEGWAQRKPNAIALDYVHSLPSAEAPAKHSTLTYAALNIAATNLATHILKILPATGQQPDRERIVPVYMSTSPELYISYLAILKAGCAFSPIPQDAPAQRVQEILQDINSPIVLGNAAEPSRKPWQCEASDSDAMEYVWIDVAEASGWKEMRGDQPQLPTSHESLPEIDIKKDQTAYLFFTSGSTGKPKGVQVSHLAVTCSIASHSTAIPLPGDGLGDFRWFQFAAPTFDPSLMEIFVTLSNGGTLCSADRALTLTDIESTVNEARATVMMATPSLAALLRPSRLTTLQSLWTMGEKLNRTVIENFAEKSGSSATSSCASTMLVNAYGPTEGAINCTAHAPFPYYTRGTVIGKALPTCAMFVLDPKSLSPKPVPSGLAGELAIGGPQVSKGYLNRPTETAKSFVSSVEFGTLYRTGDMARIVWDENGDQVIEFLGRITTDQVKVSGRRLELGEIESVLATVADVTETVAIVSMRDNNSQGSEQIIACLVADPTSQRTRQTIVRDAHETVVRHLSSYMCPSSYAFFNSLPRSSSGKVDRKAIAARLQQAEEHGVDVLQPLKTETTNGEHNDWEISVDDDVASVRDLIIDLIAETTDEDASTIKAGSDLYSLGLDSLGAMRFLQKLRDHSIQGFTVADILLSGTPQGLVSLIANRPKANGVAHTNGTHESYDSSGTLDDRLESFSAKNHKSCAENLGLKPDQIDEVLPTTSTQSGMLTSFLRSSSENSSSTRNYIYHSVIPLGPQVDIERIRLAWDTVTAEYDSFRTVFCLIDDDIAPFAQCILSPGAAPQPQWNVYHTENIDMTVQQAYCDSEEQIKLKTPPWKLSLIQSPQGNSVVLSMFHGIFDGGSLQLLLEDVASSYERKPLAKRTSLDYIVQHHFKADHDATASFWKKHLEQYLPVSFPYVTPYRTSSIKRTDCAEITARISYDSLKKRSKAIGSTPLSVLQAAWGSILLAYTGTQDRDIVMGSVVSGRLDKDSEVCVGPTYTTIPTRLSIDKIPKDTDVWTNKSVTRYLSSLSAQALQHLQAPLGSLVTTEGRLPYDTLLAWQDFNAGSVSSGLWGTVDHPPMANDFAIMVEIWPCADSSLTFRATFSDYHLDLEAANDMLMQMDDIVTFILDEPNGSFLDAHSHTRSELKSSFNPQPITVPEVYQGTVLHTSFEQHAVSNPQDLALIFKEDLDDEKHHGNVTWTYAEANNIADSLADHLLQSYGQLTNVPVPICIDKSPALYIAILAILKAGGAWCPIDTLSPAQRRHDLIARTGAKVLLIASDDGPQPEGSLPTGIELIDVSRYTRDHSLLANGIARHIPRPKISPDDRAYLIWTSGTTGAPKGVSISHAAAVSCMKSLHKDIPTNVDGGLRCLQFSQYTFDVSIQDIFYTWGAGGTLLSATREIMLGSFAKLSNLTRATHAHLTPAFAADVSRKDCKTLKVITMIGEKLTQPVADNWGTDMRAFNTYGPAEVTIVSTIREFGNQHKNIKSANIGWPMDTVSVFVMKNQRTVMRNAVGELALGGPQLSSGYLNQEDVTKAKYVYSEEASQILYYTGDLVRMLSDGSLEYINRVDDLVKLGGIRVELSEISYSLGDCHSLVENVETLVINRPDRPNQVIVAFLAAPGAAEPEQKELLLQGNTALQIARAANDQALTVLPDNMIPSVYIVVRNIPKTPSAKTDRRALQAAYAAIDIESWESQLNPETSVIDQSTEDQDLAATMTQIIDLIANLTGVSSSVITRASRLHSLGVDSIRAVRLASRMREAGYQFSVVNVLNCVTIKDLVQLISSDKTSKDSETFDVKGFSDQWHAAVAKKVPDHVTPIMATTIQESLLSETIGTYDMYWSNHFFSLDQSVDVMRLKQAWLAVCQKTEALRTGFIPVAEVGKRNDNFSMLQLIYAAPQMDWEYFDCTEQDYVELRDARLKEIMMRHQSHYFRDSPWAVTVFDQGDERVMVFTIHHSLHDAPTLRLIMDDVQSAYAYKAPSRLPLTSALSLVLPNERRIEETRDFWRSELESFAELDVPVWPDLTGVRVPAGVVPERKLIAEEFPLTEQTTKLQSAAANLGVSSIASIIRAAWGYVSVSYLGVPATVFAETLSDRVLHADLEDGVGPLISVVPVPFNPKGSARELLKEQHRLSTQSWKYRHVPAREVRKMLKRPRGEALYPAVFNFHTANEDSEAMSQSKLWHETEDQVGLHVEHPMAFNVFQRLDGSLLLEASSDSRIMSQAQLSVFVRQVDGLVSAMLAFPDKALTEIVDQLPRELLSISNRPVSDEISNAFHSAPTYWLEWNAQEHPDWTAVEVASSITPDGVEREAWSYSKLNAEANRVAAFLASLGHKNRMIAVCTRRNLPSYAVIVGIFKSGNAYLPIVEDLPVERKMFLIEDADCPLVFTETPFSDSFLRTPENCTVICIDEPEFQKSLEPMSTETKDYHSDPDDLAYLLFTSGSTGKPKGVMVTRGNLSSFVESFSEFTTTAAPATFDVAGKGRYLAQASRAFDPHLVEMFFPWRQGMATVTAPREMILDDVQSTMSKWPITHASFVPSIVDQANLTPENCPRLQYMSVGGEKITQKVLDTWATSHVAIANAYGPTEVTIGCTFCHVGKYTNMRNIGCPLPSCVGHVFLPGTQHYTLRGQTGELCFSGDIVAKGYLNRPDATGFVTGPQGEKMYRTGDIGRLMPDDSVEYLGRGDDQTKIRGQRLELGEVSEVLRRSSSLPIDVVTSVAQHPGLARVQLISFVARAGARRRDHKGELALLQSDFATLGKELQDVCKQKLPGYMVPELVLPVTYIPLAQLSAKVNVKELNTLFQSLPLNLILQGNNWTSQDGSALSRPLTADEEAVVKEICDVISVDSSNIGPMTNIFEIGLDSLSAIGLSIRLRKLGYAATVALVMSNPVIEQLAHLPRSSSSTDPVTPASKMRQRLLQLDSQYRESAPTEVDLSTVSSVRPCLPLQEGLVARSINSEGVQLYVNHVVLQLEGHVDIRKLKSAWQDVTNDNDIMRTAFSPLDNEMVQVVFSTESCPIQWTEKEYETLDDALAQQKSQHDLISSDIISTISSMPPVRFHLAKSLSSQQPLALFIAIHHALYDGESFSMLMEDVASRYSAESTQDRGTASDFMEHVYAQDSEKAQQYWSQYLAGCRPTLFRTTFESLEQSKSIKRTASNKLSELERCSANLQITVPSLLQAIFALLLADTVGASDVTYGLVLSGRAVSVPGAESVLLPCITTVPGRLNTNELSTVAEVVQNIHKSTVRTLDFQHTSLRHIQRWIKSETPLFDCLFSYIRATDAPGHGLWHELDSHMPAEYPLAVEVEANQASDTINLNGLLSAAFASLYNGEELLEKMDAVLSSIVAGESLSLENFNLLTAGSSGTRSPATQWDDSTWSTTESIIRDATVAFCGLGMPDISKGASFLSLGIDSVTAIQFARKLRESELKVSSSDIMRFSCIGALSRNIESFSESTQINGIKEPGSARIPVDEYRKHVRLLSSDDHISTVFECTPLQAGMITQTIGSAGAVYVHPHPVRLTDSVDVARIKDSLLQIIKTNDILRTSFHLVGELGPSWVGAVHEDPPFEWAEIDMPSGVDVPSRVSALYSFTDEGSFEVPPLRSVVVNQPEGKVLVIVMHHALYDGASLPFFFEDLATIYNGDNPPERPQFSETVDLILKGQEQSCDFWTNKLSKYEVIGISPLPASGSEDRMFLRKCRLDIDLSAMVQSCKEMEVTVQNISLLAYAKVLARFIGKRDVVFGQVLAGRSLSTPEAERTIGPLFNTVAQRVTFEPKFLSNKAMAQRLQQLTIDAQGHQHAPLRAVQNALRKTNDLTSASLFDALFVFMKSADFEGSLLEEQQIWKPYESDDTAAQTEHKLNVEVDHASDGIRVTASCHGKYLSQQMLDTFVDNFAVALRDIIEHPTRCATVVPERLGDLPLRFSLPGPKEGVVQEESEAPPHESVIQSVLSDISGLPVESIKPNTSIFNIGLDSLSAIRIASICRRKGLKTSVADILQGNTLRGISQRIQPVSEQAPKVQGPLMEDYEKVEGMVMEQLNLTKESIETILPCLGGQYYHLVSWLKSGRKLFEPAWPYFSSERIDEEKLQEAWFQLRQRHPVLRTCFAAISPSEAVQIVMKEASRGGETFQVIKSSASITEATKLQAQEEAKQTSSLSVPPVRLRLLKANDRDGILILINHATYDAWTMPMFVSELENLYRGQPLNTNPEFPAFVDFSVRSLRALDEKAFWADAISSATPTFLKGKKQEGSSTAPDQLFVGTWEKVKNLSHMETTCRSAGLSLQAVVLLAIARCLSETTGVHTPVMGLYQTGRSASFADIEKLSGPCLNVNPFAVQDPLSATPSALHQVQAVQSALAKRVPYEQSSLRDVLNWTGTTPLFNTWVNLLWMQNSMPSATDAAPDSELSGVKDLFLPLRIGVPTDFLPAGPLVAEPASVSALDTSFLPDENVFIDVGPDPKTDTIGFGIRVEGGVLTEEEVVQFVGVVGSQIEAIISELH